MPKSALVNTHEIVPTLGKCLRKVPVSRHIVSIAMDPVDDTLAFTFCWPPVICNRNISPSVIVWLLQLYGVDLRKIVAFLSVIYALAHNRGFLWIQLITKPIKRDSFSLAPTLRFDCDVLSSLNLLVCLLYLGELLVISFSFLRCRI